MSQKNLILGLVAFTFAVGSAFVSFSFSSTIYVKAYTSQSNFEEGIVSCVNTSETCADTGSGVRCSVQVNTQTHGYVSTTNTYRDNVCTSSIHETTASSPISGITVYTLAEEEL